MRKIVACYIFNRNHLFLSIELLTMINIRSRVYSGHFSSTIPGVRTTVCIHPAEDMKQRSSPQMITQILHEHWAKM